MFVTTPVSFYVVITKFNKIENIIIFKLYSNQAVCRFFQASRGPLEGLYWTWTPSGTSRPSSIISLYSSLVHFVKPHLFDT